MSVDVFSCAPLMVLDFGKRNYRISCIDNVANSKQYYDFAFESNDLVLISICMFSIIFETNR